MLVVSRGPHYPSTHQAHSHSHTFAYPRPLTWSTLCSHLPSAKLDFRSPSPGLISRKPSPIRLPRKSPRHLVPPLHTFSPELFSVPQEGQFVAPQDSSFPHYTLRCHLRGLLSPIPLLAPHPRCRLDSSRKPSPESYPSLPQVVVSWSPSQGMVGTPGVTYQEEGWEGVILTLQLPPLAHGFPSQGPGPGMRHPVTAESGPLELRQVLLETGTVQRGPVQPSRHWHSSGRSQKPCSGLQPARHAAMGDREAEGKGILMRAELFLRALCAPSCFIL